MISGTFHTPQKQAQEIWNDTARAMFEPHELQEEEIIERKGLYDKMILDCAFKEDLKRRIDPVKKDGGCDNFFFSITTNGLCYTFNGKPAKEIWEYYDNSEYMDTFTETWPQGKADKNFGGSGAVQGNTLHI